MADAARPPAAPAARRPHPVTWIIAAVVALAGIALIAHGAVRGLADAFGRDNAPKRTAATAGAAAGVSAPTPASAAPEGSAAETPAPALAETSAPAAEATETTAPGEASAIPPSKPIPSKTLAAPAPTAIAGAPADEPAPTGAAAARAPVLASPTAGPAYSVPAARSVARPTPTPHRALPARRRAERDDGIWVDEDGVFVNGRVVLPFRPSVARRREGRGGPPLYVDDGLNRSGRGERWRDDPQADQPRPARPSDDGPRASYPRSANPY